MSQELSAVTFLVRDYDEAIAYFTGALGFALLEDTALSPSKRWVRVAPSGANGSCLLLAVADTDDQRAAVGRQTGGRVGYFLHTTDFEADYARMREAGVRFIEEPRRESYATVVVFEDLYGNRWDLLQRA
ncbi:catechol 2,3-dioxygenase-like lactoylglutathione lyase family enzyme [Luteibacter rhizovicinus]|uniref:Catechol 2,3-dioxygenase-like lactoylglutathione lyase family enzyme n=1 Tax=Luteibacter rhizovicinus TaxID=242606 RepID=A0A4R3YLQ1_9GAMM|nr:VOC family protein [Luteibacter rhizovicinus]TCV93216.1 catechol 2,3-dioxygenase-like lactoylglutathione lyase family enzyme [Luteibacter rhizovicinus]